MVTLAETTSSSQFRRHFLRAGLQCFRVDVITRRAVLPHSSNSYLLTSNSSSSYDYKRLLCETDNVGGAIIRTYASDTTEEFGDLIGEDGQYIHQYDAQANTNGLLDDTGTVQAQYKYYAFGQVSAVSIDGGAWTAEDWQSLPLDFTSNMMAGGKKQYYLDQEIALYLLGSGNNGRYYDAATGRFLSEDPTGEAGGDENLFRYTRNDPVNNLDPSGHKDKKDPPKPVYHPSQSQQSQQHNPQAAHETQAPQQSSTSWGDKSVERQVNSMPENYLRGLGESPKPGEPLAGAGAGAGAGGDSGRNNNLAWLAAMQGKPTGTPGANLVTPSQSSVPGGLAAQFTTQPHNPAAGAYLQGLLQGAAGVMWKFNNAMSFGLWSKVQPVNPNPDANAPTMANAVSDQFVNVAATFFPTGGAEESGARDISNVGRDVEHQVVHPDAVPEVKTGTKAATEHEATQAAKPAETTARAPAEATTPAKVINETRPQHGNIEHDATAFNQAKAWQKDPHTVEARFNQNLIDASGKEIKGFRPDAQRIRITADGKKVVDVVEVQSPKQSREFMHAKIATIKKALGPQAGNVKWAPIIKGAARGGG